MTDFIIRPFQPSDTEAAKGLIGEMHKHELKLQPDMLSWEEAKAGLWNHVTTNVADKSGFMLVAESKNVLLGVIAGWMGRDDYPGFAENEWDHGFIADLVVSSKARNLGIGTALMEAAEKYFVNKGVRSIRLTAFANNDVANSFYDGYGMERFVMTYRKSLVGLS